MGTATAQMIWMADMAFFLSGLISPDIGAAHSAEALWVVI
jgi:hypothetical protein